MHTHSTMSDDKRDSDFDYLERAISSLLIENGYLSENEIWVQIDDMDSRTPKTGAKIVARAWLDDEFRTRLLAEPIGTIRQEGFAFDVAHDLKILPTSPAVHYVVVCTLCSCYPRALLGVPPAWYKGKEYRSRVVREPRTVLAEFGTILPEDTLIKVVDSTADVRYFVLPMRPSGTENYDEENLATLVSRDVLIGMRLPKAGVYHG